MDVATASLVTGPDGLALLAALPPYSADDALRLGEELRRGGADAAIVAAAMTQSELRARAVAKFGDFASGMVFTRDGLEQATRLPVAALHARRFRDAGCERIADLTCGIGADAMAAAALGLAVVAFEIDEATAIIADHNLRHWPDAVVAHADGLATVRGIEIDGAFADPARRSARGRRHSPADYSPALDDVLALRDDVPALGVKVGPGIPHAAIPADVEAQWVSVDGDVVEAALWCGPLAQSPGHAALVIAHGEAHHVRGRVEPAPTRGLGEYVYEPDGAVIRAGLVSEVAAQVNGGLVDETIAYVTSDDRVDSPVATRFRVRETLPLKTAAIASALKSRGIGALEIKKRGVDIAPEKLRPQLKLVGDKSAVLILTRLAGARVALICERD